MLVQVRQAHSGSILAAIWERGPRLLNWPSTYQCHQHHWLVTSEWELGYTKERESESQAGVRLPWHPGPSQRVTWFVCEVSLASGCSETAKRSNFAFWSRARLNQWRVENFAAFVPLSLLRRTRHAVLDISNYLNRKFKIIKLVHVCDLLA